MSGKSLIAILGALLALPAAAMVQALASESDRLFLRFLPSGQELVSN